LNAGGNDIDWGRRVRRLIKGHHNYTHKLKKFRAAGLALTIYNTMYNVEANSDIRKREERINTKTISTYYAA